MPGAALFLMKLNYLITKQNERHIHVFCIEDTRTYFIYASDLEELIEEGNTCRQATETELVLIQTLYGGPKNV